MSVDPNNKWLQLREKDGYIFMHSPWCNSKAVVVLPFRRIPSALGWKEEFLVTREVRPCHGDQPNIYSLTGGCDKEGEDPVQTAVREVFEETGYRVEADQMIPIGTIRDSKAADMLLYAYAVKIDRDAVPEVAPGDGTQGEEGMESLWVGELEVVRSPDPMIAHMMLRWRYRNQ